MGASGWDFIVGFAGSIEASYQAVREQVFRSEDYLWNYGPEGFADESEAVRPGSLAELDAFKNNDEFWEEGTHSILDTDHLLPADQPDQEGAIRPLTASEVSQYFATDQPSRADFDHSYLQGSGPLQGSNPLRWSGRCTPLYDGGTIAEVAFWGFSGD